MKLGFLLVVSVICLFFNLQSVKAQKVVMLEIQELYPNATDRFMAITLVDENNNYIKKEFNRDKKDEVNTKIIIKQEINKWVSEGFSIEAMSSTEWAGAPKTTTIIFVKKEE